MYHDQVRKIVGSTNILLLRLYDTSFFLEDYDTEMNCLSSKRVNQDGFKSSTETSIIEIQSNLSNLNSLRDRKNV